MADIIDKIKEIISFCEEIQNSNDSVYTKNCAKQTAYDHIKNIIEEWEK